MGPIFRFGVCAVCVVTVTVDPFNHHRRPHLDVPGLMYPQAPWGALSGISGTATSTSSSG
jgi:hypothetical protein